MLKNIKLKKGFKLKSYIYNINFPTYEESLCNTELKYLFNRVPDKKYFFSNHYINPHRSPFIKQCISIIYKASSFESIINQIKEDNLCCENFKAKYVSFTHEDVSFHKRRKIEYEIGMNITGEAELDYPDVIFGITKINETWIFGKYFSNDLSWKMHNRKPYSYSNALNVRVARALVNIAVGNKKTSTTVVDPCCGVGTVVLEALSMGVNIKGFELNSMIAENAIKNLAYFDYEPVIENKDMHNIQHKFDVSIIDLPYGLFSPTTLKEQVDIMKTARRISDKMIIVTSENMDNHIVSSGFEIIDRCFVSKGKFKRYITICK